MYIKNKFGWRGNIEVVDKISYLSDVLNTEEGDQEVVISGIRSAWRKCKDVLNAMCGKSISFKVKGTLSKSYVRSTLTHAGAECWELREEDERKFKTTEMRMLRMILRTLKDKINNEKIHKMTGVKRLEYFRIEQKLQWLGYVDRMDEERTIKGNAPTG